PRWENAHTIASGIRVPQAIGDFLILRAVRESGGFAIAVEDPAITVALDEMAREEGLLLCAEGAATYAAYKQSLADGRVTRTDQVVLFNCASGLKYPLPKIERKLDRHKPIDFASLYADDFCQGVQKKTPRWEDSMKRLITAAIV